MISGGGGQPQVGQARRTGKRHGDIAPSIGESAHSLLELREACEFTAVQRIEPAAGGIEGESTIVAYRQADTGFSDFDDVSFGHEFPAADGTSALPMH
ncbi:hypothetical protein [Terrarubrum flagellatum]|uniref:hypothetical protein n=1 Tax=Terrirubrum flagellatum TaxID=2895980 RepID=UPI0031450085